MANTLEIVSIVVMVAVLAFAVIRPRGLPEAVAAVPGALIVLVVGAIGPREALAEIRSLGPTVLFLAAVLVLSDLCEREGMFHALGDLMARGSRGEPKRLLTLVFLAASLTTAVLSLDTTVVLLTPVVFATAAAVGARPKPHVYATAHLANSASLLLPVSNLTNLLALEAAGLGFGKFAALMAAPWLVSLAIEYLVFRRYFASDLSVHTTGSVGDEPVRFPRFAVAVLALVLVLFPVCSVLHVETFWAALVGVVLLGGKRLLVAAGRERRTEAIALAKSVNLWFVAFVLSLGIVVQAVVRNGLADAMQHLVPHGNSLASMLLLALVAALLANIVNNLPAVLVLLPLVAGAGPVAVLAVLIGVNVGPNLTYVGSLATLLWRRIAADHDHDTEVAEFTRLGALTVPASLVLCTMALWAAARLMGV